MSDPPIKLPAKGDDKFLLAFGDYSRRYAVEDTPLGRVAANTRAKVVILIGDVEHELTPEDTHRVWTALMHASYAAEEWGKELAGHNRLRIKIVSAGVVEATWHGETRPLRLCAPRKHHRTCRACRTVCSLFWCDEKGPGYFVEVCDPCVKSLGADTGGLRPVG